MPSKAANYGKFLSLNKEEEEEEPVEEIIEHKEISLYKSGGIYGTISIKDF